MREADTQRAHHTVTVNDRERIIGVILSLKNIFSGLISYRVAVKILQIFSLLGAGGE